MARVIADSPETDGRPNSSDGTVPIVNCNQVGPRAPTMLCDMTTLDPDRLERAYQTALAALLAERTPEGHWVGELSTSALSTAVAVSALSLVQKHTSAHGSFDALINGGLAWLVDHQNADGGWGDTVKSFSNISTTMLCRAAFHLTRRGRAGVGDGLHPGSLTLPGARKKRT